MKTETLEFGRVRVALDRGKVFPDDPGAGTPALVWVGRSSGTYWCVCDTGELMDGPELTPAEMRWLHGIHDEVDAFLYGEEDE